MEITNEYKLDIAKDKKLNRDDFLSKDGFEIFKYSKELSITCHQFNNLAVVLYSYRGEESLYEIYNKNDLIFWIRVLEDFVFYYNEQTKEFMFPYISDSTGYVVFNVNDNTYKDIGRNNKDGFIRYNIFE